MTPEGARFIEDRIVPLALAVVDLVAQADAFDEVWDANDLDRDFGEDGPIEINGQPVDKKDIKDLRKLLRDIGKLRQNPFFQAAEKIGK